MQSKSGSCRAEIDVSALKSSRRRFKGWQIGELAQEHYVPIYPLLLPMLIEGMPRGPVNVEYEDKRFEPSLTYSLW